MLKISCIRQSKRTMHSPENRLRQIKRSSAPELIDKISGLFLVLWFFFPNALGAINSGNIYTPLSMTLSLGKQSSVFYALYLVPVIGVLKMSSLFLGKKLGSIGNSQGLLTSIYSILTTYLMLYAFIYPLLLFADNLSYFKTLSKEIIISLLSVITLNIFYMVYFIKKINRKSKLYREFKKSENESKLSFIYKIRTKLFLSIIGIITAIIIILSSQLLGSYRITLLKAIGVGASSQVDQTSNIYKVNLGDEIAMHEYMERQASLNSKADFQFSDLSIFTSLKSVIMLDSEKLDIPPFRCEYSTLVSGIRYPELKPFNLERQFVKQIPLKDEFSYKVGDQYKFVSMILSKKGRLLGFSVISYHEDILMAPYFKIRNKVILLTVLFLYLTIILIYFVGNFIVTPILYVRMNVMKISGVLAGMIKGEERVNPALIFYNDNITSKDEIKQLSSEVNNMVTVIRGIVPYISHSTLKNADKDGTSSIQKELTFLFTDIRGFTSMCEGMEPDSVVHILNKYLNLETQIILKNHGDVDKFVGDEMMAFFEGPNKELNACKAAMEIRQAMMEEKDIRVSKGQHVVEIGIGINTGKVVFGSVGARDRMDFTSIGDTVNLAARLEGANKAYSSKSIISEAVYNQIKNEFLCRELDFIAVKGKNEPIRIYELLQRKEIAKKILFNIKDLFEKGLKEYRDQNWDGSLKFFKRNIELYTDEPSRIFVQRINHFISNPPGDSWDGVFRMEVK